MTIHGSGDQTRDFTYVSDAVEGTYLVFTRSHGNGDVYNIGTGKEISINELYKLISRLCEKKVNAFHTRPRTFHIGRRSADISKVSKLGYLPKVGLKDGLKKTLDYFLQESGKSC